MRLLILSLFLFNFSNDVALAQKRSSGPKTGASLNALAFIGYENSNKIGAILHLIKDDQKEEAKDQKLVFAPPANTPPGYAVNSFRLKPLNCKTDQTMTGEVYSIGCVVGDENNIINAVGNLNKLQFSDEFELMETILHIKKADAPGLAEEFDVNALEIRIRQLSCYYYEDARTYAIHLQKKGIKRKDYPKDYPKHYECFINNFKTD